MPIYEYRCLACRRVSEFLILNLSSPFTPVCPRCDSSELERVLSRVRVRLSEETRSRAFEPFYSTKRGGTGLGLAIVSRIADVHRGEVRALNCPEGGAAFTLSIPQQTAFMKAAA